MRRWSEVAGRVAATTKTSEKTALLADYLRGLSPDELPVAAVFLTGRPFAEADQRSIGLGWSAMATAIAEIAGVDRDALGAAYDRHSDLGLAVEDVLVGVGHAPPPEVSPTLPEVAAAFAAIEAASGPARKVAILRPILERSDPATVKGIVKVLGGDLRIGLREGLLEAAIAKAFDRPLDDVKWAGMLTGDVGRLASLARDDRLADAEMTVFHPLKFMLASPAEDAAEIIRRLGPEVWVEDKYDGIRAQLHKRGGEVRLFSRDLHDVTTQFPEIAAAADRPRLGRHPRRRDPRLEGRRRAAVRLAPGAAGAQDAVGGDPGRGARDLRRLRCAGAGSGCRCADRAAAARAADRAAPAARGASTSRWPATAVGSRARPWRSPRTPTRSRRRSSTPAGGATRA